jgi:4-methyl-5(b-hydroxyethyl)-thiazole monophosphate biosynthesis
MPTILAILAEGFEEIEATTPIDLLRRAGAEVITAALGETMHVTGKCGITLHADTTLTEVESRDFDGVFLPGGPGTKHLRADPRVPTILKRHHAAGRIIAAICAAPTVLHDAGLLTGKRYTAHFSVANELPELLADQRVVEDGQLITSRGAGTALDLGLALIARFYSPDKAREIAASVCA